MYDISRQFSEDSLALLHIAGVFSQHPLVAMTFRHKMYPSLETLHRWMMILRKIDEHIRFSLFPFKQTIINTYFKKNMFGLRNFNKMCLNKFWVAPKLRGLKLHWFRIQPISSLEVMGNHQILNQIQMSNCVKKNA